MSDADAFRQLAADLDAKSEVCRRDAGIAAEIGPDLDIGHREGLAHAYSRAAGWIRDLLDGDRAVVLNLHDLAVLSRNEGDLT